MEREFILANISLNFCFGLLFLSALLLRSCASGMVHVKYERWRHSLFYHSVFYHSILCIFFSWESDINRNVLDIRCFSRSDNFEIALRECEIAREDDPFATRWKAETRAHSLQRDEKFPKFSCGSRNRTRNEEFHWRCAYEAMSIFADSRRSLTFTMKRCLRPTTPRRCRKIASAVRPPRSSKSISRAITHDARVATRCVRVGDFGLTIAHDRERDTVSSLTLTRTRDGILFENQRRARSWQTWIKLTPDPSWLVSLAFHSSAFRFTFKIWRMFWHCLLIMNRISAGSAKNP